ncbi:hypothetical protein IDJ75_08750 [Mucilaginibacter rigui]|uniref:Uncharacterized protein n=1 Tax=Mucilaginibacter rigui TaxID=534635 RepID=A0ABR7X443_9SPHI|nr:hypothetical protein [Mucilaginibacter rigui]MBD1385363.1 hypothetical protein [Mucilaginibacter rigui]
MSRISAIVLIAFLLSFVSGSSYGQNSEILIAPNITLPKDTAITEIITSLNSLRGQIEGPNKQNKFILPAERLTTYALVDEMKGMEQNAQLHDKKFYKPYLTNIVKQRDGYLVQIAYIGVTEGTPVIRASFKLIAKKQGGKILFYSPLKQNTTGWKTKTLGNITFRFKDTLNTIDTKAFQKTVALYDKKLQANAPIIQYYCDNFAEAQQLLGVDYKADYAGVKDNNLTANENGTSLIINGWGAEQHRFDPHDLFHDRLRTVLSPDVINRPVDEGAAYLYGGSWGFTWPQIITKFKTYVSQNPNADWLTLYSDGTNFNNEAKILKISYVINALIIQQLEKEKGFPAVMELLSCGKKEKGDENYFKALAKLTGINKADFNVRVGGLIKAAK